MHSIIKAKKNQLIFLRVLKIIAFIFILAYLFYRLNHVNNVGWSSMEISNLPALILVIVLIPVNWFVEFLKWHLTTQAIISKSDFSSVKNSFYAGMVTGLLTPNMIGNFIGRMYYFKRKDRVVIILLTLISNQAQFLITVLLGTAGFILIPVGVDRLSLDLYTWVSIGLIAALSLLSYFQLERILQLFSSTRKIGRRLELVFTRLKTFRSKVLILSFLRYLVFIVQFALLLVAFGAEFELMLIVRISEVYLISALIPTLFLGKLGVRESVGVMILGSMGISEVTVVVSSLSIWFLNLILPTMMALVLLKFRKD